MIFATMEDLSGDSKTVLQVEVSHCMQHAWTLFARDPVDEWKGLGWPAYNPEEKTLVRLGYGEETSANYADPKGYDGVSVTLGLLEA